MFRWCSIRRVLAEADESAPHGLFFEVRRSYASERGMMLDKEGLPPDQHRLISQESSGIREDAVGLQHPDCDFVSLTQPLIEPEPMFD